MSNTEEIIVTSTDEVPKVEIKLRCRGRYPLAEDQKKPKTKKPRKQNNSKEYNREYYHTSKTEITCECGMVMNKRCLNRHLKRRVHEENLKITQSVKTG
jgi:hypothetical protein